MYSEESLHQSKSHQGTTSSLKSDIHQKVAETSVQERVSATVKCIVEKSLQTQSNGKLFYNGYFSIFDSGVSLEP